MAYDEELADRIRDIVDGEPGITEKRMFGGLAFLVDGHLAAAASSRGVMLLRVDPDETEALLEDPAVRRSEMGGRRLKGWLDVDTTVLDTDGTLQHWVAKGVAYARLLGPK